MGRRVPHRLPSEISTLWHAPKPAGPGARRSGEDQFGTEAPRYRPGPSASYALTASVTAFDRSFGIVNVML